MIKVLIVSPFSHDANSYHRCMGPWTYLAKHNRDKVQIALAQDDLGMAGVAWDQIAQFDAVFFHRPCRDDDMTMLKIAKNLGIPVWADFDDWLFDVPYWNQTKHQYDQPGIQNVIATFVATADVVTVSTSALYDRFRLVNSNVVIIPNMYRSDIYRYRESDPGPRLNDFVWRGTNTHDADLLSVCDGFKRLPGKTLFFGGPTWVLLSQMRPGSFLEVGTQDNLNYMKQILFAAPKVLLFPLVDCFFNRCKSNIAYQEALHAGALCVAPDLPEWNRAGVVTYAPGNAADFERAATQAIEMDSAERASVVEDAFDHMRVLYDAPNVNPIREQVLYAILAPDFKTNPRDPFDPLCGIWALGKLKGRSTMPQISEETLQKKGLA